MLFTKGQSAMCNVTDRVAVSGYLGDGQVHVPAGPLHRADGVPHLGAHHPGHHRGEVTPDLQAAVHRDPWAVQVLRGVHAAAGGAHLDQEQGGAGVPRVLASLHHPHLAHARHRKLPGRLLVCDNRCKNDVACLQNYSLIQL